MRYQETAPSRIRVGRPGKFTSERIQQIKDLISRGETCEVIAAQIGVTVGTLKVTCSRLGISLRRPRVKLLPPSTATATAKGVDAGGAALGSSFTLNGTTHTNAGTYAGDAWSFSGGTNYKDASGTVDDSIAKAPLTITADNKTIVLHAALPQFTVTPIGFVNGESFGILGGTLTFTPTTTPANAGTYDIVPSGYTSNNYMIKFQKGTLTVMYSTSCIILGDPTHAILQPINPDGSSVSKAGSTVPAKFRVADANCNSIGTPGVVISFRLIAQSSDPNATINEDVTSTTPDTAFRWDPTAQQWIFNISTKGMKAGVKYTYQTTLNDGSSIIFSFALR